MQQSNEQIGPLSSDSAISRRGASAAARTVATVLAAIVTVAAFVGLLIGADQWLHTLSSEEKSWVLIGLCGGGGAALAAAVLDRERRVFSGCCAVLAALGVVLVLTAGGGHVTEGHHAHNSTRGETTSGPHGRSTSTTARAAEVGKRGHSPTGGTSLPQGAPRELGSGSSSRVQPKPTVSHAFVAPVHSAPAPTAPSKSAASKSSVTQVARGKEIAQAVGHSNASVGDKAPAPAAPTTGTGTPSGKGTSPPTSQTAEGDGIAQASEGSTASVSKGDGFVRLVPSAARRSAIATEFSSPLAHAASHKPKHHRKRRRHKRKHPVAPQAPSAAQHAQGQKIAQAVENSTAVVGSGDPINSPTDTATTNSNNPDSNNPDSNNTNSNNPDSNNTNSGDTNSNNTGSGNTTIGVQGGTCGTNIQEGSSGSVTVSENGSVGTVTSGGVTNIGPSGSKTCGSTNIQIGESGSVTVSGNTEVGDVTSGSVENIS